VPAATLFGMRRHRRVAAALLVGTAIASLLAGCAAPGDVAVVRDPAQFVIGTDGDGLPDAHLESTADPAGEPVIALDGRLWRVQTVVMTDPVVGSTIVTATLEDVETGEVVTRTFDAAALSPIVGR